jgi:hypothetical protein
MTSSDSHPNDIEFAHRRVVPITLGKSEFRIRQITDTHHKGDGFRKDLFKSFVEKQSRDKNSLWIHTGDVGDPDRNSRREIDAYANANRKSEIITQSEKNKLWAEHFIIPLYAKIASSCIGFIAGDHYMLIDGKPCTEYICKRLNIPYLGEREAFIQLVFDGGDNHRIQYSIHARHGKGGARTVGGDVSGLIKQEEGIFTDLHLGAHTHKINTHVSRTRYINHKGAIKSKLTTYMRGGSFLDNPNYARKAEYSPLPCGWGEVELTISRQYHGRQKSRPLIIAMSKASIISG